MDDKDFIPNHAPLRPRPPAPKPKEWGAASRMNGHVPGSPRPAPAPQPAPKEKG